MAVINLLLGKTPFSTVIGAMKLDAAESLNHEFTSTPSKNPIEDGSEITDNVRVNNGTLSITGMISDSPLRILNSALNIFTGSLTSIGETAFGGFASQALAVGLGSLGGIIAGRDEDDVLFPQKAFDYLLELRKNKIPFNIQTDLKVYENMILTKLSVPRTAADGRSLKFSASFEQITIVRTGTIILPERNTKNLPGATKKQNLGKQPRKEATASNTTVLRDIFNGFG